jgi:hypothetical protein
VFKMIVLEKLAWMMFSLAIDTFAILSNTCRVESASRAEDLHVCQSVVSERELRDFKIAAKRIKERILVWREEVDAVWEFGS